MTRPTPSPPPPPKSSIKSSFFLLPFSYSFSSPKEDTMDNGTRTVYSTPVVQSLLQTDQPPSSRRHKPKKSSTKRAAKKTFKASDELSNLLPTGSVLAFQTLAPVITQQGKYVTTAFLSLCAASCFFSCFTDSFIDRKGKVRYGVATFRGIWVIDSSEEDGGISKEEAAKYKVGFMDFFHAGLSVLVFVGLTLFDKDVINCFFSGSSKTIEEILLIIPLVITVVCSVLFVLFPTKRHGIGHALSQPAATA
ncbi:protein DMP7-like [Impatiens glandulifera]|uniref:protein DMP7-like n=1 Tax=Impatiens glandulifera TaxID=253017 RepID=UPI001FB16887|nr:protein DMP7-like [Impatiens glandulifera]